MRTRCATLTLGLLLAAPCSAQINVRYAGTQLVDGARHPVTTQFSLDRDRVAAVFKGTRSSRMIYVRKDGLLRVIDDDTKSYFDLADGDRRQLAESMASMQKQMEQMPPAQRAMMQQMGGGGMGSFKPTDPVVFVASDQKQTVRGYECTRVDAMRGAVKRGEYWGSRSPDFAITPDERATRIAMQEALSSLNVFAQMGGPSGETRPFEWDPSVDGFPLISRCFEGDVMTLDVTLASFDRQPVSDSLFDVPKGYTQQSIHGGGEHAGRAKHGLGGLPFHR